MLRPNGVFFQEGRVISSVVKLLDVFIRAVIYGVIDLFFYTRLSGPSVGIYLDMDFIYLFYHKWIGQEGYGFRQAIWWVGVTLGFHCIGDLFILCLIGIEDYTFFMGRNQVDMTRMCWATDVLHSEYRYRGPRDSDREC